MYDFRIMPTLSKTVGSKIILDLDGQLILGDDLDDFRAKWTSAVSTGTKEIIIDLGRIRKIDSSGIGSLVRCHSSITAKGGKIRLVGANETIRQAFHITRLDRVFEFHQSLDDALAPSPRNS